MPRAGLSTAAVVATALAMVDEAGTAAALSLTNVAQRCGVATPSLYKHVDGLPALRRLVTVRVLNELGDAVERAVAGTRGADGVRALGRAYRAYVLAHPGRFDFLVAAPDPGDAAWTAASDRLVGVLLARLAELGLTGPAGIHAARCVRASVHGFAGLEVGGGFGRPEDVAASFEHLLTIITDGFRALATKVSG